MTDERKKAIIDGKEYKLNYDGTPSFGVCLSGCEDTFKKSINKMKKLYDFSINSVYLNNCELLFIYADCNGLSKRQKADIFAANVENIKIIIIHKNKNTPIIDSILTAIDTKVEKFYCPSELETGEKIRSRIAKHSYGLKLKSNDWEKLKEKRKKEAGYRCQICNAKQESRILVTHHRTYDNQGTDKEYEDLICLCKQCHEVIHEECMEKN